MQQLIANNEAVLREVQPTDASVDKELAEFFHRIIVDGRYLEDWSKDVAGTAASISFSISKAAQKHIADLSSGHQTASDYLPPHPPAALVKIVLIIAIVVVPGFNILPNEPAVYQRDNPERI